MNTFKLVMSKDVKYIDKEITIHTNKNDIDYWTCQRIADYYDCGFWVLEDA